MEAIKINSIVTKWGRDSDFLIEMLQDVQDEWRHLPEDVLRYLADELRVPLAKVNHVATFYKAFSLEPRGDTIVKVCMGTTCHIRGGPVVVDDLEIGLGIAPGETTKDMKYTIEIVNCVGACALAPVVIADAKYHANVKPGKIVKLLEKG